MSCLRPAMAVAALLAASLPAAVTETARSARRDLSTDRPDATESPFTVEPGFFQLEMDFANFTRHRQGGVKTEAWEAAPFNLRAGVTRDSELGVFVVPYVRETETVRGGPRERRRGFGDLTLRGKLNFTGNDGGEFASGLILDVKLPTGARAVSNRKTEGALTLPFAFGLGGGWEAAAMTSAERVYSESGRYRGVWSNTFTVGRELAPKLGGFAEVTSSTGDGAHVATFNVGLTRELNRDAQLDCGVNLGLSRSAPDLQLFAGVSQRF